MRINEAVGAFLKRYRAERGLTLDDIATASRRYGSGWSTGTISQLEKGGSKADSLPVLIILARSISDLEGDDVTLAELFDRICALAQAETVRLTDTVEVTAEDLRAILRGEYYALLPDLRSKGGEEGGVSEETRILRWFLGTHGQNLQKQIAAHVPSSAEERAAKKLCISVDVLNGWCFYMYKKPLDAVVAESAGVDASPQKRGRVMRRVLEEVKSDLLDVVFWYKDSVAVDGRPPKYEMCEYFSSGEARVAVGEKSDAKCSSPE